MTKRTYKQQNDRGALSTDERGELIKLRKENNRLQMAREILKKVSANTRTYEPRYYRVYEILRCGEIAFGNADQSPIKYEISFRDVSGWT